MLIEKPYQIAKYPVTNLQYRRFVDADGYMKREYWSNDGWAWRDGEYHSLASTLHEIDRLSRRPLNRHNEPAFWRDLKWNNPLAPIVGVNWFEAEAYCNWLSCELNKPIRLPYEEEWARAACHTDGRAYPWGNRFDRFRLNSRDWWGEAENEARSTTMVGQFEGGNSVAGISDMSGNVWEWTNSWFDDQQREWVLRGGSWDGHYYLVHCAVRAGLIPDDFGYLFGFRVCSPSA